MKNRYVFLPYFLLLLSVKFSSGQVAGTSERKEVSQYGITWTFDKPAKTGQFITGDWWVIGPVNIVAISPAPGPTHQEKINIVINRWNDTSLKMDTAMRNGSMVVLKAGSTQGYDSRSGSFRKEDAIVLPFILQPNLSLISSESNTTLPVDNFCKDIMWDSEKKSTECDEVRCRPYLLRTGTARRCFQTALCWH